MNKKYMRPDHTDWLIHFVRDRNPEQDFPGSTEEEANSQVGGELEADASAFEVLLTVIRLGGLIPGHSFRKKSARYSIEEPRSESTIYGGQTVICATEMPLYSFAKQAESQSHIKRISPYGIAFLKSEFFAEGGRPVIYGLSTTAAQYEEEPRLGQRVFTSEVLPVSEQYRYVAYNPQNNDDGPWIDWSHEREWRWKVTDENRHFLSYKRGNDYPEEDEGLPLFSGRANGGHFSKLGILVWDQKDADTIQELLTNYYFSKKNEYGTPFDRSVIFNSFIIILKKVIHAVETKRDFSAQTIEGLKEENLLDSIILRPSLPPNSADLVRIALKEASKIGEQAAKRYKDLYPDEWGECGIAHVFTNEIKHPIVQHLLSSRQAYPPIDEMVRINITGNWPPSQSVTYHQYICEAMAESLRKSLDIHFYVTSRLN